jgi:hypothetical protein
LRRTEPAGRVSLVSFGVNWIASALLTWALVCLLALTLLPQKLEAGLLPTEVLLTLALVPIAAATLVVQTLLLAIGSRRGTRSRGTRGVPSCLVTAALTFLALWALTRLLGGADAFIPRL